MPKKSRHKAHSTESGVIEALPYIRVSSDEQEREGLSLPAQLAACRRYAAEKGWVIGEEYQDVLTGTRDDRPHYQRLLADIRQKRVEGRQVVVVVAWLHRFGRRVLERVRCREELKGLGVPVHSAKEGGEVSDLVSNILASVAEEEVRQLSERVSEVVQHTMGLGWHPVGRTTWGYRWRPATSEERARGAPKSVLEEHPGEAPTVRELYRRIADGKSLGSVNLWVASLPEEARGGRVLGKRRLRGALRNPIYTGRFPATDETPVLSLPRGHWPALIDDAIWQRVQEHLNSHQTLPRQASNRYLLTGFLRCPRCDARMIGSAQARGNPRYRCSGPVLGASAPAIQCTMSTTMHTLDESVLDEVISVVSTVAASDDPRLRAAVRREWQALREPKFAGQALRELRRLEGIRGQAKKRLADAAIKLVDGELDKAGYDAAKQRIERDLQAAETDIAQMREELQSLDTQLPPFEEVLDELGGWTALRTSSVAHQREILSKVVERVVPVRAAFGRYRAEITPTDLGKGLWRVAQAVRLADAA